MYIISTTDATLNMGPNSQLPWFSFPGLYCLPRPGPLPYLSTLLACPHLGPWKLPSLAAPSVFTGLWSSALLVTQFWPQVTMASRRLPPPPWEQRCLLTARALRPAAPRLSPEDLQANTEPGHHQCLLTSCFGITSLVRQYFSLSLMKTLELILV